MGYKVTRMQTYFVFTSLQPNRKDAWIVALEGLERWLLVYVPEPLGSNSNDVNSKLGGVENFSRGKINIIHFLIAKYLYFGL